MSLSDALRGGEAREKHVVQTHEPDKASCHDAFKPVQPQVGTAAWLHVFDPDVASRPDDQSALIAGGSTNDTSGTGERSHRIRGLLLPLGAAHNVLARAT